MAARSPFDHVAIITGPTSSRWESALIRGALWYHELESVAVPLNAVSHLDRETLPVLLPDSGSTYEAMRLAVGCNRPLVVAGHAHTTGQLQAPSPRDSCAVSVLGEPYERIVCFARDGAALDSALGTVVVGHLMDVRQYRAPADAATEDGDVLIMSSLGCEKRCGYCHSAWMTSQLYGGATARRSRPWRAMLDEMLGFAGRGVASFRLVADQFLSCTEAGNRDLLELAQRWPAGAPRPSVVFTAGPMEVSCNKRLLAAMSAVFDLYPRLSIDSFDEETLAMLGLGFPPEVALEAYELLVALGAHVRVNYIFARPGMTMERVSREAVWLQRLVNCASRTSLYERMLLCHDLFASSLQVRPGMPIADAGVRCDYHHDFSSPIVDMMLRLQRAMESGLQALGDGIEWEPLSIITDTLPAILRDALDRLSVAGPERRVTAKG